jgi:hypothetical protein
MERLNRFNTDPEKPHETPEERRKRVLDPEDPKNKKPVETKKQIFERIRSNGNPDEIIENFLDPRDDITEDDVVKILLEKNDAGFKERLIEEIGLSIGFLKEGEDKEQISNLEEDLAIIADNVQDQMIDKLKDLRDRLERIIL